MRSTAPSACRWHTIEDLAPRDAIERWLHDEGQATERVTLAVPVRHPVTHSVLRTHLMVRAFQATGEVTAAWELYDAGDDCA